jgi:hypothetical protein
VATIQYVFLVSNGRSILTRKATEIYIFSTGTYVPQQSSALSFLQQLKRIKSVMFMSRDHDFI